MGFLFLYVLLYGRLIQSHCAHIVSFCPEVPVPELVFQVRVLLVATQRNRHHCERRHSVREPRPTCLVAGENHRSAIKSADKICIFGGTDTQGKPFMCYTVSRQIMGILKTRLFLFFEVPLSKTEHHHGKIQITQIKIQFCHHRL